MSKQYGEVPLFHPDALCEDPVEVEVRDAGTAEANGVYRLPGPAQVGREGDEPVPFG